MTTKQWEMLDMIRERLHPTNDRSAEPLGIEEARWLLARFDEVLVNRSQVRGQVLAVLNRDLTPWTFTGHEPMAADLIRIAERGGA